MSATYLIIGASGGIGTELSRRLVQQGAQLLLCGRNASSIQSLGDELQQPTWVMDAKDWSQTEAAVQHAVERFGKLDGAVNLAGSVLLKPAHLTTFEEWQDTLAQNLTTAMGLIKFAAPVLRRSGGGSLVLMSSAAAAIGLSNHEAIAAAKAGVEGLVRSAAATYAAAQVRINAVAPGLTQTPLTRRVWENPKGADASLALHALGRLGTSSDIASAIQWLLDPAQSWLTAQVLTIDGGLSTIKSQR